ncbi:hypothetical protein AVEN_50241-1 [Araneus ventricosus]|uniref:Uncharacterized protein n=1 Tax=Araneus ventricosus TaxID=182803 RepID=A0A4Y2E8M2_ARAVE|nr:hypothetical protein AVEN_50241-1 [Araneus ventricosus]
MLVYFNPSTDSPIGFKSQGWTGAGVVPTVHVTDSSMLFRITGWTGVGAHSPRPPTHLSLGLHKDGCGAGAGAPTTSTGSLSGLESIRMDRAWCVRDNPRPTDSPQGLSAQGWTGAWWHTRQVHRLTHRRLVCGPTLRYWVYEVESSDGSLGVVLPTTYVYRRLHPVGLESTKRAGAVRCPQPTSLPTTYRV